MARRLLAAATGVLLVAALAGCVSIPSGGPVQSYTVTQSPGGNNQAFVQRLPQAPLATWTPTQIVQGFLTASGSLDDGQRIAKEYLTPEFSKSWKPEWSAIVYSKRPSVEPVSTPGAYAASCPAQVSKKKGQQETAVMVTGTVQATVESSGSYAVPSAKAPPVPQVFELVKAEDSPWRICWAPPKLLLTSYVFGIDYQQRNLYFFDPAFRVLVPDPVYVPVQATPADLMQGLVNDLASPPKDWLYHATSTAFPDGTKVGQVTLDGVTATVSLTVADSRKVPILAWRQFSSQLYATLTGSGQGGPAIASVQLMVNGKLIPLGTQQSPVQSKPRYSTPQPASTPVFYYLDGTGNLVQQNGIAGKSETIGRIGKGFTQIAVSPPLPVSGIRYLAALRGGAQGDGTLYTAQIGAKLKLVNRGTGYASMSWAPDGDLWTTGGGAVFELPAAVSPGQQADQANAVNVVNSFGVGVSGMFSGLRVAPDGVRVAVIVDGSVLDFGAITQQPGAHNQTSTKIELSQSSVDAPGTTTFSAVTWYGPDNVITLDTPGPVLTEYPVNGGSPTVIPPPAQQLLSITASASYSLIAGVAKEGMIADISLTGAWAPVENAGQATIKGISPVYPG